MKLGHPRSLEFALGSPPQFSEAFLPRAALAAPVALPQETSPGRDRRIPGEGIGGNALRIKRRRGRVFLILGGAIQGRE